MILELLLFLNFRFICFYRCFFGSWFIFFRLSLLLGLWLRFFLFLWQLLGHFWNVWDKLLEQQLVEDVLLVLQFIFERDLPEPDAFEPIMFVEHRDH